MRDYISVLLYFQHKIAHVFSACESAKRNQVPANRASFIHPSYHKCDIIVVKWQLPTTLR